MFFDARLADEVVGAAESEDDEDGAASSCFSACWVES
jgi:hypothetical protein